MIGNISSLRRQVKNVACNYSDAQVKVREATSNDPWGPSSSLMSEIAEMTNNTMAFAEIMQIIWKRLNDHGKNWRHVYKSLVLLDYLIKIGSEKIAQQCKENIFAIQTLKDFQYIEENKDQGMNVREKAKQLVNLLKDEERLKNERARALMAKKRFAQNGMGISSDGSTHEFRRSDTYHGDYDDRVVPKRQDVRRSRSSNRDGSQLEECRPGSLGEEQLQLQIALALSKEEAQKEEEMRKGDDIRLRMALVESSGDNNTSSPPSASASASAAGFSVGQAEKSHAIDDLLALQPAFGAGNTITTSADTNDPWTNGAAAAAAVNTDPWGAPVQNGPPPSGPIGSALNDPWAAPVDDAAFHLPAAGSLPQSYNWSSSGGGTINDQPDPFATSNGAAFQSPPPIHARSASADPWSMEHVRTTLPAQQTGTSDSGMKMRQVKTPEHFLGENSALVNLDNLMGPMPTSVAGVPAKSNVNNPFAGSSLAAGSSGPTCNPFAAQQRPSPTLNEMRSATIEKPMGFNAPPTNTTAWNLPQPLNPSTPSQSSAVSSTNPFL